MPLDVYEGTLYGQILPLDLEDDSDSGVSLFVDGEEEFVIEQDEYGLRLLDHIDRWATVSGVITETEDEYRIKVRKFKIEDEMDFSDDNNW